MPIFHHSRHEGFDEAIIGFSRYCRENDLDVGLSHTQEALRAISHGFAGDVQSLKFALKSLFCKRIEEHEIFDKCFDVYWGKRRHEYAHKVSNQSRSNVSKKANASLVMMGFKPDGMEDELVEDTKSVTGASGIESLKKTDFSKIAQIDSQALEELADQLLRQLNHRLKRKLVSRKKGRIDIRKTIRNNMSTGDDLINLYRKSRKLEKYRLVLLLDVSGSMDKYSFFLLKFLWSLKNNLKNIEAFVFSTKLIRISDFLHQHQLDETLWRMSHETDNWSSGTRIGACMKDFNEKYAKRILNGKSITIVLSDGLDQGEPEVLSAELEKIRMRTSKLVWLNPLKGMEGYEPLAKGMKAALPKVGQFGSAHNLESLMELENILASA
ncbi:MAG: VWA domain-containing protein [Bacteroidota bacterium]